jgi:hypothetical protein
MQLQIVLLLLLNQSLQQQLNYFEECRLLEDNAVRLL